MQFTTANLIDNLDQLGPWSAYTLAEEALRHYFPDEYGDTGPTVVREAELCESLGCMYWQDLIRKYHTEVGYKRTDGLFNPEVVNQY